MNADILDGDWVQATEPINDESTGVKCAARRGIGEVVGLPEDPEWYTVRWERTGAVMDVHATQIAKLCDSEARPKVAVIGAESDKVADIIRETTRVIDVTVCTSEAEADRVRRLGGAVWGVRKLGETKAFPGAVTEYLYFRDEKELADAVRWKVRGLY